MKCLRLLWTFDSTANKCPRELLNGTPTYFFLSSHNKRRRTSGSKVAKVKQEVPKQFCKGVSVRGVGVPGEVRSEKEKARGFLSSREK